MIKNVSAERSKGNDQLEMMTGVEVVDETTVESVVVSVVGVVVELVSVGGSSELVDERIPKKTPSLSGPVGSIGACSGLGPCLS